MTRDNFITERTRIISEMLDNPDVNDIYPTGKCFEQFDELFDKIVCKSKTQEQEEAKKIVKCKEFIVSEEGDYFGIVSSFVFKVEDEAEQFIEAIKTLSK